MKSKHSLFNLEHRVAIGQPFSSYQEAADYDRVMRKTALISYLKAGRQIVKKTGKGMKIVEVGTKSGMVTFYVAGQKPDNELVGVEDNGPILEVAKDNLNLIYWANADPDIELEQCELTALPFEDGYADIVFSHSALHLWKEPAAVLRECRRICKKDGFIFIDDPNRWAGPGHVSFILQFIKESADSFLESVRASYNEDELLQLLREAGMQGFYVYKDELDFIISNQELEYEGGSRVE